MSMMEAIASIALIINDFLAIISLLGSLVLLLEAGSRAGKRRLRSASETDHG